MLLVKSNEFGTTHQCSTTRTATEPSSVTPAAVTTRTVRVYRCPTVPPESQTVTEVDVFEELSTVKPVDAKAVCELIVSVSSQSVRSKVHGFTESGSRWIEVGEQSILGYLNKARLGCGDNITVLGRNADITVLGQHQDLFSDVKRRCNARGAS